MEGKDKQMRKIVWMSLIALVATLSVAGMAFAQSEVPDDVQVFHLDTGQTCVVWPDGNGECYCPCETGLCVVETEGLAPSTLEVVSTDTWSTATPVVRPSGTTVVSVTTTSTPEVEGTVTPYP